MAPRGARAFRARRPHVARRARATYIAPMQPNDHAPSHALLDKLLWAMVAEAPRLGWSEAGFRAAAKAAGLSEGEAKLAAPGGADSLLEAFSHWADEAMAAKMRAADLAGMKIRAKVRLGVAARLEAFAPYKAAVARGARRLLFTRDMKAASFPWRAADRIWKELGDTALDANFYSKRAILAGVIAATMARWLADESPNNAATEAFLDARIEGVMAFEKFKTRLAPLAAAPEAILAMMARLRYPRAAE